MNPSQPDRPGELVGPERLQKILAHAGIGSRRSCEELISQGRVTVNGQVIRELGTKVDLAKASVSLDGQKIQVERPVYFAVYKPKGYVSTNNDPSGRPRVLDLLPEIPQRVYTVGRLDEMSVGLLLLTNDGELANKLAHPRFGVEKLYRVVVAGSPEREVLNQLTDGIWLAEGKVRAKRVKIVGKRGESTILELVLAEGKNREVRRMLAKLGHKVMTLTRVAVGPITIKGLTAGQFRPLTGREVDLLRRVADGQSVPMPWMTDRGKPFREPARPRRPRPRAAPPTKFAPPLEDRLALPDAATDLALDQPLEMPVAREFQPTPVFRRPNDRGRDVGPKARHPDATHTTTARLVAMALDSSATTALGRRRVEARTTTARLVAMALDSSATTALGRRRVEARTTTARLVAMALDSSATTALVPVDDPVKIDVPVPAVLDRAGTARIVAIRAAEGVGGRMARRNARTVLANSAIMALDLLALDPPVLDRTDRDGADRRRRSSLAVE